MDCLVVRLLFVTLHFVIPLYGYDISMRKYEFQPFISKLGSVCIFESRPQVAAYFILIECICFILCEPKAKDFKKCNINDFNCAAACITDIFHHPDRKLNVG